MSRFHLRSLQSVVFRLLSAVCLLCAPRALQASPDAAPSSVVIDRFNDVAGRMADPKPDDDLDKLMDEMSRLQERIDACGGWELDRMMDVACDALVLPPDDAPVPNRPDGGLGGARLTGRLAPRCLTNGPC